MSLALTPGSRRLATRLLPSFGRNFDQQRSNTGAAQSSSGASRGQAIKEGLEREQEGGGEEDVPRREISRDMRGEAESSNSASISRLMEYIAADAKPSPSSTSPTIPDHPAQTFDWRLFKATSRSRPQSITKSLNNSWNNRKPTTPPAPADPPRVLKGVHDRQKRAQGTTPSEAHAVDLILANILNHPSLSRSSSKSPSNVASPYIGRRGEESLDPSRIYTTPLRPGRLGSQITPGIFNRLDPEEDHEVAVHLDRLKEDMSVCRTDVDLISWAKNHVFQPIKDSAAASSVGPSYPPVYPRILAHLLGHIRRNYANPHLVLALFQHAQTQSPESYVSGCLAPAYNEILKVKWESFVDLEAVEASLREMDANGVKWDKDTARQVSKIVDDVAKDVWQGTGWHEKYGEDVHARLARLEQRLQKDVNDQNRIYEVKARERADARMRASMAEQRRESYANNETGEAGGGGRGSVEAY